jgi:hypothetical protein
MSEVTVGCSYEFREHGSDDLKKRVILFLKQHFCVKE